MRSRSYVLRALLAAAAGAASGERNGIPALAVHSACAAEASMAAGSQETSGGQPPASARNAAQRSGSAADQDLLPPMNWTLAASLAGHKDVVTSLAFSPDGSRLFSSSFDGVVKVWDTKSHKEEATFVAHPGGKRRTLLGVSPAGDLLATGAGPVPGEVKIWDVRTLQLRATLSYPRPVYCLAFSRQSDLLAAAGENTVYVWRVATSRLAQKREVRMWPITGLAFSPDGRVLYVGGFPAIGKWAASSGVLRAFDLSSGSQLGQIEFPHPVESLALNKSGSTAAVAAAAVHALEVSSENHRVIFKERFSALEKEDQVLLEQFVCVTFCGRDRAIAGGAGSPGPRAPGVGHVAVFALSAGKRMAQA